jgi:hypothetical protein
MNVRQSVLGEVAVRSGLRLSAVDIGSLVRRLILFDKVIVKSFRLREMPVLVRAFGKDGFGERVRIGLLTKFFLGRASSPFLRKPIRRCLCRHKHYRSHF